MLRSVYIKFSVCYNRQACKKNIPRKVVYFDDGARCIIYTSDKNFFHGMTIDHYTSDTKYNSRLLHFNDNAAAVAKVNITSGVLFKTLKYLYQCH